MEKEEREEEGQVVPEVGAAWEKLLEHSQSLLDEVVNRGPEGIKFITRQFQRWFDVLEAEDPIAAFRKELRRDLDDWLCYVEEAVSEGNISDAIDLLRGAERCLIGYAKLLGQEVPPRKPEEEKAAEEVTAAVVEPEVVRGTPLRELSLSGRVYNRLVRSKALAEAVGIAEDDSRLPYVEEVARVFAHGAKGMTGEEFFLNISLFGPKSFAELKQKLKKLHLIVEPWEE